MDLGESTPAQSGWTIAKWMISTAIGAAAVAVPFWMWLLSWGSSVEQRVTLHSAQIQALQDSDARQERDRNSQSSVLDRRLERIENKLDSLVDREVGRGR